MLVFLQDCYEIIKLLGAVGVVFVIKYTVQVVSKNLNSFDM